MRLERLQIAGDGEDQRESEEQAGDGGGQAWRGASAQRGCGVQNKERCEREQKRVQVPGGVKIAVQYGEESARAATAGAKNAEGLVNRAWWQMPQQAGWQHPEGEKACEGDGAAGRWSGSPE